MLHRLPLLACLLVTINLAGCVGEFGGADPGDSVRGKADYTPEELAKLSVCRDREPEIRTAVMDLLRGMQQGTLPQINSIDAFVAALPASIKQNVMFFTDTRAKARIYPLSEKDAFIAAPHDSDARQTYKDGDRWCVRHKDADGKTGERIACLEARVFIASTEGDFIGTWTTHPQAPSKDRFELAVFDASKSNLDYFDIDFRQATPVVTKNPRDCMQCHGGKDGTINYRMDPYRFWAYMTPFNEDNLRAGSVEVAWYTSFLDRIKSGETALRHLAPFNTKQQILDGIARDGSYQLKANPAAVDFAGTDTPGLNMSHQLLEKNACRAAKAVARSSKFDKVKYALMGGLFNCSNVDDFFPASGSYTVDTANAYFARRNLGVKDGAFSLDELTRQTSERHVLLLADRLSRRFDHFADFLGDRKALDEIRAALVQAPVRAGYGVTNFESYGTQIAKARYLLEPLGIDVSQWSMSVDRENNSHVEFLYPIPVQPVFIDTLRREFDLDTLLGREIGVHDCKSIATNGEPGRASDCYYAIERVLPTLCGKLAEKSRAALTDYRVEPQRFESTVVATKAALDVDAMQLAASSTLDSLTQRAAQVYRSRCAGCHTFGYNRGMPHYPFTDSAALNRLLAREQTAAIKAIEGETVGRRDGNGRPWVFEYISYGDRIWDRITRHPTRHGAMPRMGDSLSRDNKVLLRAHMLKVWEDAKAKLASAGGASSPQGGN